MAHVQLRLLLVFGVLTISTYGSYCGKTAVPYSFEVLPNGAPVLGCAQPSCVAAAEEPLTEDSEFLTDVAGQSDGFFRDGDRALKRYRHDHAPKLIANCSGQFNELSCPRKNQFVGGIEFIDHPRQPLILQCCTYDGLRFSQEVGTTSVGPGEAITGGEVIRNGRQISFDVIANVRKIVRSTGSQRVTYEVTVRRMNCLPDPVEPEVDVDEGVPSEVLRVLSNASAKEVGATEKPEKKGNRKGGRKNTKQNAAPTEEISDDTNNQPNGLGRNNEVSLAPIRTEHRQTAFQQPAPLPPQQPTYQQPLIPPQTVPQQPQQQLIDPNQQQPLPPAPIETSTAFPPLPTLIPTHTHTFPTLPPHTHTFPTLPPHTFPTFTFPPFTATPAPFPAFGAPASSSGVAFAAPSVSVGSPVNPPAATALPTFPTFAPFPGFSPLPLFGATTPAPFIAQQQDSNTQQVQSQQPAALPQQPQQAFVAQQPVQAPLQQPTTIDGATQQQFQSIPQQPQQTQVQQTQFQQPAAPPSSMGAMGTILQNFQGAFRPIELPGMGIVGYGSATKK